jgi:hypothetical protein
MCTQCYQKKLNIFVYIVITINIQINIKQMINRQHLSIIRGVYILISSLLIIIFYNNLSNNTIAMYLSSLVYYILDELRFLILYRKYCKECNIIYDCFYYGHCCLCNKIYYLYIGYGDGYTDYYNHCCNCNEEYNNDYKHICQ